jgi:hypothetical protein
MLEELLTVISIWFAANNVGFPKYSEYTTFWMNLANAKFNVKKVTSVQFLFPLLYMAMCHTESTFYMFRLQKFFVVLKHIAYL